MRRSSSFKPAPGKRYSDMGIRVQSIPLSGSPSTYRNIRSGNSYGSRKAMCRIK